MCNYQGETDGQGDPKSTSSLSGCVVKEEIAQCCKVSKDKEVSWAFLEFVIGRYVGRDIHFTQNILEEDQLIFCLGLKHHQPHYFFHHPLVQRLH